LDNFDNVIKFLKILSSEKGHNLGLRHVSLSTCGVVDKIYDLANMKLQLTLSVSLHAPNDELRNKTMPINQKFKVKELLDACKYYANHTSRRVSFEYALIRGFNDTRECADELAKKLHGIMCHLNLIPVNEIDETDFIQTEKQNVENFRDYMVKLGINTTIRRTLGTDINAACGQLRRNAINEK
ncbi:MAG: 23S rRNA (adenine(2503)-C(2))-methyltransferase RlmN, partial [Oscillospiraceae bacterium]